MFGPKKEGAIEGELSCIVGEESTFSGEINVGVSVRIGSRVQFSGRPAVNSCGNVENGTRTRKST